MSFEKANIACATQQRAHYASLETGAAEILLRCIAGTRALSAAIIVQPELVVRGATGPAHKL